MSGKSEAKDWSMASREKRPSPLGSTLFVGLRAADAVLQYSLLRQGWAADAVGMLGGQTIPTVGAGPAGLTPYGAVLSTLAAVTSFKHVLWQVSISEQEMTPPAATAIGAFNTVVSGANTLLSAWALTSAAPTNLPASAPISEVILSSPSLIAGVGLFTLGIATELYSEFQRKWFKSKPENKGKPYGGGLWSLATNINYGGYTLWRTGYAMAAAGPIWGLVVGGFFFYDFTNRAIPVLDRYCTDKYGDSWLEIKRRTRPDPPLRRHNEDDYYSLLLSQPLASTSPTIFAPPSSPHPSPEPAVSPRRDPSILFGTPLAGPSAARRRAGYGEEIGAVGGLERPREPDNCCMSGCVNCVWDAYREEVEAWAIRKREAAKSVYNVQGEEEAEKRKANEMRGRGRRMIGGPRGHEVESGTNDDDEGALFEGVPVGIREFMATEKRLRERSERAAKKDG
ncbi:MAG: hypothetical protein Q9218_006211 [Villophora microphyllina]